MHIYIYLEDKGEATDEMGLREAERLMGRRSTTRPEAPTRPEGEDPNQGKMKTTNIIYSHQ